jgi:YesN/AraC family two-component response regulator
MIEVHNSGNNYIYNIDQLVKEYGIFEVMLAQIQKLILQTKIDYSVEGISGNINFLNIMKYVSSNYSSDISVKSVAEHLKLNANYVSQLFSKETGGFHHEDRIAKRSHFYLYKSMVN